MEVLLMRDVVRTVVLGGMLLVLGASVAAAAPSPGRKCQSAKNQEAGKYASCLFKAEAKLLKVAGTCSLTTATECYADGDCPVSETCTKSLEDTEKYTATVGKCLDKFNDKWDSLTGKAVDAGDPCPDGLASSDIQDAVDEHVANVAAGLAGEGLSSCGGPPSSTFSRKVCTDSACTQGCQTNSFPQNSCIEVEGGGSLIAVCEPSGLKQTFYFLSTTCTGPSQDASGPINQCAQDNDGSYFENICP